MKTIVITGTSRGIGAALSLAFAQEGHRVISISRKDNPDFAKHQNITHFGVDLCDEGAIRQMADRLLEERVQIDALVHNAGKLVNKPLKELTYQDFEEVYQVNVFGVAMLTKYLVELMRPKSHVVTVSSMGGIQGSMKFPGLAAYSSSKGAVITLSELLAEEYKEQQIAFNVLALGAVQTEMLEEAFPGFQAPVSPEEMAAYIKDFALSGHKFYNGKVLQVSSSTP